MTQLTQAIILAAQAHDGQVDKLGVPYIFHVMNVMVGVRGFPEDYPVVACLHDVVEDTSVTLERIKEQFGERVAEAVDAITHRKGEEYETYLGRVDAHTIARWVKWQDLTDNLSRLRTLDKETRERLMMKYEKACQILQRKDKR